MDVNQLQHLLIDKGKSRNYGAHQLINLFDEKNLYLIKEGYVKRYLISNGGQLGVQSIYGPGYIFPLSPILGSIFGRGSVKDSYYYESITAVKLCEIAYDTIAQTAKDNYVIYRDLLFEAWRRLQSNIAHLDNMALKDSRMRVAHELVSLANEYGAPDKLGIKIQIPLSQQDIADILNLTRETVARTLSRLKALGAITTLRKKIIVTDIVKLQTIYDK